MEIKELRQKEKNELTGLLGQQREKLQQLRFELSQGKVKDIRAIRETKKTIARILTLLNANIKIQQ